MVVGKKTIEAILERYSKITIDFDVYIVAQTQVYSKSVCDERIKSADENEFFSRTEFAEIASAIFNVFGFVKVFYDEISFIEYFIRNKINYSKTIVYNLSRNGKRQGKKSLIPSFCDLINVMYTGCDAFVISLIRNKLIYSQIANINGISVPLTRKISLCEYKNQVGELASVFNKKEIIIKFINESASLGLTQNSQRPFNEFNLNKLFSSTDDLCEKEYILQEFISGDECEVFVVNFDGKYIAMNPIKILLPKGHTFIDSDVSNSYNYEFELMEGNEVDTICMAAIKAAETLGIKDYARFDFRVQNGTPYLIDIAGTPYTIRHSSIAYLFNKAGLSYEDIYKTIITCTLSNYGYIK